MRTVPTVVDSNSALDIYSRLLTDRIIFLTGPIDDATASTVCAQLLYLDHSNAKTAKDIHFYINSPGGSVTAALAIYDTMQFIISDVCTYCYGQAASAAALLLAAGAKNKRFILPHARTMIHQPLIGGERGITGQETDIRIYADDLTRTKKQLEKIFVVHTGQSQRALRKDMERDSIRDAKESQRYGLVDHIVTRRNIHSSGNSSSNHEKIKEVA